MIKRVIKYIIISIIRLIEHVEYKKFDESDKVVETITIPTGYEIRTDTGFKPISHIHLTKRFDVWKIQTSSGKTLEGADEHIVFDSNMNEVFIKDLKLGDAIQTKDGVETVTLHNQTYSKVGMMDITVADNNHRFYSNDILSHNSVMTALIILHYITFNTEKNVLFVANKWATVKEIIQKFKEIFKSIPFFLQPGVHVNNEGSMWFDNDCRLQGSTTTADSGIGFSIDFLFADEFAKIDNNILINFWKAVYPTLKSIDTSRCIITSTPDGFNLFHDLYDGAVKGLNRFAPMKTTWDEIEGHDEKWKQEVIADLGGNEDMFNQEFGCQFNSSSNLLIDKETIEKLQKNEKEYQHYVINSLEEMSEEVDYSELLWDSYFDDLFDDIENKRFLLAIDLADGLGGDYSVINIFEMRRLTEDEIDNVLICKSEVDFVKLVQVGLFRSNKQSKKIVAYITMELVRLLGEESTLINFEVNQGGDYFYKCIEEDEDFFDDMLIHTKHRAEAVNEKPGVKITTANKKDFCNEMKNLLRKDMIIVNEKQTVAELMQFGKNKKGSFSAQSGHDDIAMSIVQIPPALKSSHYIEMIDDIFIQYDKPTMDKIYNKLEMSQESDYVDYNKYMGTSTRY